MLKKPKEPFVPPERYETIRKQITTVLEGRTLSARELSIHVRVSEKEIYENIEHIRKAKGRNKFKLIISPARCKKCGFIFKKRERIRRPSKCPLCRSESIEDPLFSIKQEKRDIAKKSNATH